MNLKITAGIPLEELVSLWVEQNRTTDHSVVIENANTKRIYDYFPNDEFLPQDFMLIPFEDEQSAKVFVDNFESWEGRFAYFHKDTECHCNCQD